MRTAHAPAEEAHTGKIWTFARPRRSIGPSSPRSVFSAPYYNRLCGKIQYFSHFFWQQFFRAGNAHPNHHFFMETTAIFCISKKMRGFLAFLSCIFFSVALQYHRLTRADNAFQRAIPVCLIQLRPPRSAPPQSPMGNPGYGSAQVNPSYAFHSPVRLSIMK